MYWTGWELVHTGVCSDSTFSWSHRRTDEERIYQYNSFTSWMDFLLPLWWLFFSSPHFLLVVSFVCLVKRKGLYSENESTFPSARFPYIFDVMEYVVWQWPFATEGSFVGTKVKVSGTTDMVILSVTYNLWSLWSQVVCLTPLQVFNTSGLPLLTWKTRSCLSWPKYFDRCVVEVVDSENSTFCSQANLRRKKRLNNNSSCLTKRLFTKEPKWPSSLNLPILNVKQGRGVSGGWDYGVHFGSRQTL